MKQKPDPNVTAEELPQEGSLSTQSTTIYLTG